MEKILTTKEAAAVLGKSVGTLRNWIHGSRMPQISPILTGCWPKWGWKFSDIEKYLENKSTGKDLSKLTCDYWPFVERYYEVNCIWYQWETLCPVCLERMDMRKRGFSQYCSNKCRDRVSRFRRRNPNMPEALALAATVLNHAIELGCDPNFKSTLAGCEFYGDSRHPEPIE